MFTITYINLMIIIFQLITIQKWKVSYSLTLGWRNSITPMKASRGRVVDDSPMMPPLMLMLFL